MSSGYFCQGVEGEIVPGAETSSCENIGDKKGDTFVNDTSWPCLRGINTTDASERQLHYIVPNSYFTSSTDSSFNIQLQLSNNQSTKETVTGFPTFSLFNGMESTSNDIKQYQILAEANVQYTGDAPDTVSTQSCLGAQCVQVNDCGNDTFDPPDFTHWAQYAFSATVAGEFYGSNLILSKESVLENGENCVLASTIGCEDHSDVTSADMITEQDVFSTALEYSGCVSEPMAVYGQAFSKNTCLCTGIAGTCENDGTATTCYEDAYSDASVPVNSVSANYRDGYQRLQAQNVEVDDDGNQITPYTNMYNGTISRCSENYQTNYLYNEWNRRDTGQVYTGYKSYNSRNNRTILATFENGESINTDAFMSHNVPNQVQFNSCSTCAPAPESMQDGNALVLMDVNKDQKIQRRFVQLQWNSNSSTPKPQFMQEQDDIIYSFNVMARMPTCLNEDDVQVSDTTKGIANSNHKTFGCFTNGMPENPWKWSLNQNLGFGTGTYQGGSDQAWSDTLNPDWPSLGSPISETNPDIVVRIVFYNNYLFDLKTGSPVTLNAQDSNLQDNLIQLWSQNHPDGVLTYSDLKSYSLLDLPKMRICFYEYMAAILYRCMYSNFVENNYFSVRNHLITDSEEAYTSLEFFRDYFVEFMSLSEGTVDESDSSQDSLGDTITRLSQEILNSAQDYFRYPEFTWNESTGQLEVGFYCDLCTHLTLLNQGAQIQDYLNVFFQDASLATVQYNNQTFESSTIPQIKLSTTFPQEHVPDSNLSWNGTKLSFVTSYYWTQPVVSLSPISMLYIALNFSELQWSGQLENVWVAGIPRLISSEYQACLEYKPLSSTCADLLCSSTNNCLCDYSIVLDGQDLNPQSSLYFNTSNGACACLASQSMPIGANSGERALGINGLCFSQACQDFGYISDSVQCETQGCASFLEAVDDSDSTNIYDGTWENAFQNSASDLDIATLNTTCGLNLEHYDEIIREPFQLNYYAFGSGLALTLVGPLMLLIYKLRAKTVLLEKWTWIALGIIQLVFMGIGALLVFMFSNGTYKCSEYNIDNLNVAPCVDGLTHKIPMSQDVCQDKEPVFCQCESLGSSCGGYLENKAECNAKHMCCVCPNNCEDRIVETESQSNEIISSNLIVAAVGAFILLSGLTIISVPIFFGYFGQFQALVTAPPRHVVLVIVGIIAIMGTGLGLATYYLNSFIIDESNTLLTIDKSGQEADLELDQACFGN